MKIRNGRTTNVVSKAPFKSLPLLKKWWARCHQDPGGGDPRNCELKVPELVASYSPPGATPRDAEAFRLLKSHQPWSSAIFPVIKVRAGLPSGVHSWLTHVAYKYVKRRPDRTYRPPNLSGRSDPKAAAHLFIHPICYLLGI